MLANISPLLKTGSFIALDVTSSGLFFLIAEETTIFVAFFIFFLLCPI